MSLYTTVGTVVAGNKVKASEYNTVAAALNLLIGKNLYVEIPEADRPTGWVLSGGEEVAFTDVDFSSYVASGVTSLLLKYVVSWTGDGTDDRSVWVLRKNGSTVTDADQLTVCRDVYYNLDAGIVREDWGEIIINCDSNGLIEYKNQYDPAVGKLYLNIKGYYVGI